MRWDLIEHFDVLKKGHYSRARKSFTGEEDFFKDHFPGRPLVPETLLVEMIAQTGGVLFGVGINFEREVILAKIGEARFFREIPPPCQFLVEATIEEEREEGALITGTVKLGDAVVAEAKILLITIDGLGEGNQKQIVFNENFFKHYDILNVIKTSQEKTF